MEKFENKCYFNVHHTFYSLFLVVLNIPIAPCQSQWRYLWRPRSTPWPVQEFGSRAKFPVRMGISGFFQSIKTSKIINHLFLFKSISRSASLDSILKPNLCRRNFQCFFKTNSSLTKLFQVIWTTRCEKYCKLKTDSVKPFQDAQIWKISRPPLRLNLCT